MNSNGRTIDLEIQKKITDIVFPDAVLSIEGLEAKYPPRELPNDAMVMRIAPSPTGFMHIGGIYMALIAERFAHQAGGVYFLRIEDTDKKREVEGAKKIIVDALHDFGVDPDEGLRVDGAEHGAYGPYSQSERKEIYASCVKFLLEKGDAYLCFCGEEELEAIQKEQQAQNVKWGYYGKWAKWRDADPKLVLEELEKGTGYVVRFRSTGDSSKTFTHHDVLKGEIVFPENDLDAVIMKSDRLPTYHMAHAVDDHFMRTTHVSRGDEWLSSVPLHYDLFGALGFALPQFAHVSPINKLDQGNKRKLSKRKDPEANVLFYKQKGYLPVAVIEYLLNLANSDFEDWRKENPDLSYKEFPIKMSRLANSNGPLFDETKLKDIAKEKVALLSPQELFDEVSRWAKENDEHFFDILTKQKEHWVKIFGIERGGPNARKDISDWSEVYALYAFFDTERFSVPDWGALNSVFQADEIKTILGQYATLYDEKDEKPEWLEKIRGLCADFNLAPDLKSYKFDKLKYRGHIGEITQCLRFAITGRTQSPDLFEVMRVLDRDEVLRRLR